MKGFAFFSVASVGFMGALPSTAAQCSTIEDVKLTFYGWPDNDPPGADNAFDCGRGTGSDGEPIAGGTGMYADPISFATATDNNNLPQCGIVYVPLLRKYFRNEDDCARCKMDWDSQGLYHIDLWTGSNQQSGGDDQTNCEYSLPGGSQTIIKNPPGNLAVDTTPLYDVSSQACYTTTYSVGDTSSLCSGGGSSGSGGGSQPSCTWAGHCLGDPCQTYNDCDGTNICGANGVCVPSS